MFLSYLSSLSFANWNIVFALTISLLSYILAYIFLKGKSKPSRLYHQSSYTFAFEHYLDQSDNESNSSKPENTRPDDSNQMQPPARLKLRPIGNITNTIKSLLIQINEEAQNFIYAEFRIIIIFSLVLSVLFYIFKGEIKYPKLKCLAFILGCAVGLLTALLCLSLVISALKSIMNTVQENNKRELYRLCSTNAAYMATVVFLINFLAYYLQVVLLHYFLGIDIVFELLCFYGLGISYSAFFARISGGIFTKGADISCDIVGKLGYNFQENDEQNPSSVADNLGDIVGDLIGSTLDLIASMAETFTAFTIIFSHSEMTPQNEWDFILLSFSTFSLSLIVMVLYEALLGYWSPGDLETQQDMENSLFQKLKVISVSMVLVVVLSFNVIEQNPILMGKYMITDIFICSNVLIGISAGFVICYSTYFYTSKSFSSVRELAEVTSLSPSLNIIYGLVIGYFSTYVPVFAIAFCVIASNFMCGIYGLAFSSFGVLMSLPVILQFQMFGPLVDVALGLSHMSNIPKDVENNINTLDTAGNSLSAVVKGFSTGSAGLVSFALYGAIMLSTGIWSIDLKNITVLTMVMLGGLFTYTLKAVCMKSTCYNATILITACKDQIQRNLELREYNSSVKPDYFECIQESAQIAYEHTSYITWGCIGIIIAVYSLTERMQLLPFLTGIIMTGIPASISSSNSGSAWDNSKKAIESNWFNLAGFVFQIRRGSYESDDLQRRVSLDNAIIGDNIGDAFKDIAGPSVTILIKFSSFVCLIIFNFLV